ncbi:hypothetical protein [Lampropedia aestuarii]|uniref:hypothetical protein n=1 Tax=Lampropedia aestuarii TaxID=2562762 RepID=UPI002469A9CF|nr:hypothetical protein [Lampropedia aestuarii]MDH5858721.1 hypothetical protein [Lampropedia aestuarii]
MMGSLSHGDVDIIGLQNAAHVRVVGRAAFEALDGGLFVAKRTQEVVGECIAIKRFGGLFRDGGFDFYGVHWECGMASRTVLLRALRKIKYPLGSNVEAVFHPLKVTQDECQYYQLNPLSARVKVFADSLSKVHKPKAMRKNSY